MEAPTVELLAQLSHTLRSPLTAIMSAAETLLRLELYLSRQERHECLQTIKGASPDTMNAEVLREQVWTIMEPYFLKIQQEAAAKYREYAGTNQASHTVRQIILAANAGRVESLFVAIDQEQWGVFDPVRNTLHVHKEVRFGDDDLLDIAATQTLLHSGAVYSVEQTQMPDKTPIAAVLRY